MCSSVPDRGSRATCATTRRGKWSRNRWRTCAPAACCCCFPRAPAPRGFRSIALVGSVGLIAKHANVPVQTLVIETDSPFLEQGLALVQAPDAAHHLQGAAGTALRPTRRCARLHGRTRRLLSAGSAGRAAVRWLKTRMTPSSTHLVLIPSYNPGPKVVSTGARALEQWAPVWVVVDGSTDHSEHRLSEMAATEPDLASLGACRKIAARAPRCCSACARRRPWGLPMR